MYMQTNKKYKWTVQDSVGLVILILYSISKYYFLIGVGILIMLILGGEIHLQNAKIWALSTLMFFPLHYLNKRLNGKPKNRL